jgi:thiamine-monophosphate kinase
MTQIPLGGGAEFDLIRRFYLSEPGQTPTPRLPEAVRVAAGDDCAIVRGEGIALSVDMSVEGVHFMRDWLAPEEIGYRATAAALSDLAAVAATPIGVLAALAIDPRDADEIAPRIMNGVRAAAAGARAVLLGGDMSRTDGPLVLDMVVIGNAHKPALRRGARPGDSVWVTGELGAAAAAVRAWKRGAVPEPAARLAFALPTPRIAEAGWLAARRAVDALIDISDGLASDVSHIAAASGVRIIIDATSIPVHPAARADALDREHAVRLALAGGEDYELCFAAPAGLIERIGVTFMELFSVPLTRVGTVHEGSGVGLRAPGGAISDMPVSGYDHFSGAAR